VNLFEDTYQTIHAEVEGVFRDKGSKFIAYAYPFSDESKLKEIVGALRNAHPKARHFCYAYRLSTDRTVFRINDDGEPSGTAGRPILNVLLSKDVTNILVIVVRYFGGTLLGVPGLINAYKSATLTALEEASIILKTVNELYTLQFEYLQLNEVMSIIKEEEITVSDQLFDLHCTMQIELRQARVNRVFEKLNKIDQLKITHLVTR